MTQFSKYDLFLSQKLQQFISLTTLSSINSWRKAAQKDELIIHTFKDSNGITAIRSEGPINYSPETLFSLFWNDVEALKKVDDSIADYRIIASSSDDTQAIIHSKYKPAPLVAPRDIIMIIAYKKEKGRIIIYGGSIKYPEEKGYLRADCKVWGWILKENNGKTWAINVNYTDLAGKLPSFVIKPVLIKEHGYLIKRAEEYLKVNQPKNNKFLYREDIKPKL